MIKIAARQRIDGWRGGVGGSRGSDAYPKDGRRVANITVVQGAQGVYEAKKPGRTTLSATGDLPCRKAQPPCMAPTRVFEVELVVQ